MCQQENCSELVNQSYVVFSYIFYHIKMMAHAIYCSTIYIMILLHFKYLIISHCIGSILIAEAKSGSEIGKIMNSFMQEGKIIPSEYTFQYLRNEFSKPEYTCGILLDGYPKDEECYHFVTSLCQELGFTPLSAVFFDISREIVQARLEARIYCPNCETNYHKTFKALQPLVENVCDKCSHIGLSPRLDDNLKTITKRLDVFDNSTRGNVELFRRSGILHTISAGGHPDDITSDILRVVNEALKAHRVKSQSYYLYPLREPERSTKWHNHIDGPNIDVIESIVRRIHDVQPNAQNKIYPIKDLFLCQQIFNNKFVSVYGQMPNFHYIRNSTTEAFTTGKMGEEGLDYDLVNLTLSIVSSIPHAMTEIEEDLYEASYSSSTGCEVIHRDDGDSTTTIDWSKLTASKYGCDGQLRTETETEALGVDWYQCLLPSIPKYELHHAVDIPLSSCHDLPFTVEKLNLCIASNSNHLNNSLFDIGGLFMFKKKDVWAYRTSEFSNMSYEESLQRLKAQALVLHDVIGSLVENKDFYCALSLEKVHAIWKFD